MFNDNVTKQSKKNNNKKLAHLLAKDSGTKEPMSKKASVNNVYPMATPAHTAAGPPRR